MILDSKTGRINTATWLPSPNYDAREQGCEPQSIIVHCISLPPGKYGGGHVERFFQNQLDAAEHPYFEQIKALTVSSHFLISRSGELTQFVSTFDRAWHAGESYLFEQPKVNNFSIGIELEGLDTDEQGFTEPQYQTLAQLTQCLQQGHPAIQRDSVYAHSDIAPGRKPDPGRFFKWGYYLSLMDKMSI